MEPIVDIGTGIYSVPEAARILNLPTQKVAQWIRRYWELDFLEDFEREEGNYTEGAGRDRLFNFYTLIELIAVSTFRKLGVSFKQIKKAHRISAQIFKTKYPFAKEGFMTDGKKIFHNLDKVSSIILDEKKQLEFRKLIEPFCEKIDFDELTGIAERYWPLGRNHEVVVDPKHRFGEPTIKGTNISASVINSLIQAGEPIKFIADEYQITEDAVRDAIKFFKHAS